MPLQVVSTSGNSGIRAGQGSGLMDVAKFNMVVGPNSAWLMTGFDVIGRGSQASVWEPAKSGAVIQQR